LCTQKGTPTGGDASPLVNPKKIRAHGQKVHSRRSGSVLGSLQKALGCEKELWTRMFREAECD
jgi:hypothetical protein